MLWWKLSGRLAIGLVLLSLASCRPGADAGVEPTPPLPSAALIVSNWYQGLGVLVDRDERLVLASAQTVGAQESVEVIYSVVEEGKAKVKRDYYMKQAPRQKARVLSMDPVRDLVVLQVESVPEGMPPLKLAAKGPEENAAVQALIDTGSRSTLWSPKAATVTTAGEQSLLAASGQRVTAKMLELTLDSKFAKASNGAPVVNEAGELVGIITNVSAGKPRLLGIDASEARNLLSLAYRKMGTQRFAEACRKLDSKKPAEEECKKAAEEEFKKAVAYCDKALELNPGEALTYNERGAALSYLNKFDEAIAAYSKALEINPRLARALRNRASAYLHQGKPEKAVEDATEAIKIDSKYINAYQTRHEAYRLLKKLDLAKADESAITELSKEIWRSSGSVPDR